MRRSNQAWGRDTINAFTCFGLIPALCLILHHWGKQHKDTHGFPMTLRKAGRGCLHFSRRVTRSKTNASAPSLARWPGWARAGPGLSRSIAGQELVLRRQWSSTRQDRVFLTADRLWLPRGDGKGQE